MIRTTTQVEMLRALSKAIANEWHQALVEAIDKAQEAGLSKRDIAEALRENLKKNLSGNLLSLITEVMTNDNS